MSAPPRGKASGVSADQKILYFELYNNNYGKKCVRYDVKRCALCYNVYTASRKVPFQGAGRMESRRTIRIAILIDARRQTWA